MIRNLDKIFRPQRVVLIGIDNGPTDIGKLVLSNLLGGGFRGIVYPVSFTVESVSGVPTFPSLESLPKTPDLAIICTPAADVARVVDACGKAGILGILILSSGFSEKGESGRQLELQVSETARRYEHMRIIGPNSQGIIVPEIGLNASCAVATTRPGQLAFISQSHSLSNAILDWAADAGVGFSLFASLGNTLDVGYGDLIDYLGTEPRTKAIILYIQSIRHARRFMSAARSFARTKPILAYKAGHYRSSARVALSHTGNIAGEEAVYSTAFERAGIVRVWDLDNVFDVAEILSSQRLPAGSRLAIVGNAGGPSIIAIDALLARRGTLAELDEETVARLREALPDISSHQNPVDLNDTAGAERYAAALEIVQKDPSIDALMVIFASQPYVESKSIVQVVIDASKKSTKPLFAAWMGGASARNDIRNLNHAGVPANATPEQAIRAFMHLVTYARNLQSLYETPRDLPVGFTSSHRKMSKRFHTMGSLTENEAKLLLKAYDIPVCDTRIAHSADEAVEAAGQIGYPVVLKLRSADILHKTDIGGVALELQDASAVHNAFENMMSRISGLGLAEHVDGVTLQRMMCPKDGLEMILGATRDRNFGPVIMIGLGGVATAVYSDHAFGLPPLNETLARNMVESLRCWPMLQGYRGRPPVSVDRLIEIMIRFSCLIADYPDIREFDINPLIVTPETVVALDAAAVLEHDPDIDLKEPYAHMAIRPYPEQYMRRSELRDGTRVVMRPIRPEDEPLWHRLVASSSPESIRFRFRSLFKHTSHTMAVQHCMIDYERELAMVVEKETNNQRELIGIAQLLTDLNHETAEYAVLVPDPWQGRGIGGMLLDYCLEHAARWGISEVIAETDPSNKRMLSMFQKRGFDSEVHREDDVVYLRKRLEDIATGRAPPSAAVSEAGM